MNVVRISEYRARETLTVLRYVLGLALRGEISGLALCFRRNGHDEYAFTGEFQRNTAARHEATGRMFWKVNRGIDELESSF